MILMHKDIPVADVKIYNGYIEKVNKVYSKEHFPIGTYSEHKQLLPILLQSWQKMRAVPTERQNIDKIQKVLGMQMSEAQIKSLSVSLTDCYWLKPDESKLTWEDVNYHDNGFSEELGYAVMIDDNIKVQDFNSPDLTTDGMLEKAWISLQNVPTLLKRGNLGINASGKNILSANEIIASKVADLMKVDHVKYFPVYIGQTNELCCACNCFIKDNNTEFVNAHQIEKEEKKFREASYEYFSKLGFKEELDKMLVFDCLLQNTDRHQKNFGLLRNSDTLEYTGFAPLFDSGSCLGWNDSQNRVVNDCKPFYDDWKRQLELVGNIKTELPDIQEIKKIIKDIYELFDISDNVCHIAFCALEHGYSILKQSLNIEKQYEEYER